MDNSEKEKFEELFSNARRVVEQVSAVLHKELDTATESPDTVSKFDNPNWALLQAHSAGYREALRFVLNLITGRP